MVKTTVVVVEREVLEKQMELFGGRLGLRSLGHLGDESLLAEMEQLVTFSPTQRP